MGAPSRQPATSPTASIIVCSASRQTAAIATRSGGIGFGFAGRWPGWFALAKDLAVDDAGNIYVTDAFNGRLQTFTADGQLRAVWGDPQRGDDEVDYASGVAIASAGRVYVGDFSRNEIWEIACPGTDSRP